MENEKGSQNTFISPIPVSILIGSIIIAVAILVNGGVIKIKGFSRSADVQVAGNNNPGSSEDIKEKLIALAGTFNLDKNKFKVCMEGEKHKEEISKDSQDGQTAGVDGTPSFFIGKSTADGVITGVKLVGAQPFSAFKSIIDEQLTGNNQLQATGSGDIVKVSVDDDPVIGEKSASLTMVEFSDYECPFCKRYFTQTFPDIVKQYVDTGKLKVVFRDFPLSFHEPNATVEAIAANCAREQGGDKVYFQYHDAIFTKTQSNGAGI